MSFLNLIQQKINTDKQLPQTGIHTFLNPYSYIQLSKHQYLLVEMDSVFVDGEWLCKFLKWFGVANPTRKSFDMTSIAPQVFEYAEQNQLSLALVGGMSNEIQNTVIHIKKSWPKLDIKISHHGFFENPVERQKVIDDIITKNVSIVVVGMGVLIQEEMLIDLKRSGWKGLGFSCGAFLKQSANGLTYYPEKIDKMNLRWIYRMYKEPHSIKRYLIYYPIFVIVYIKHFFTQALDKS